MGVHRPVIKTDFCPSEHRNRNSKKPPVDKTLLSTGGYSFWWG